MKVFITGGTGFVGTFLSRELVREGHAITILSRKAQPQAPAPAGISFPRGRSHPGGALDGGGAGA